MKIHPTPERPFVISLFWRGCTDWRNMTDSRTGFTADERKAMRERVKELVKTHAPDLGAKTLHGMPASGHNGRTILFFQSAGKFKVRLAALGFREHASLDEGQMWPTSYALNKIYKMAETRIIELIKRATRQL
jgi:hypothetical protein